MDLYPGNNTVGERGWPDALKETTVNILKFEVTIQIKIASGGPAGGQTFEKFDKQVLMTVPRRSMALVSQQAWT